MAQALTRALALSWAAPLAGPRRAGAPAFATGGVGVGAAGSSKGGRARVLAMSGMHQDIDYGVVTSGCARLPSLAARAHPSRVPALL